MKKLATIMFFAAIGALGISATAQSPIPIFDAHLHYNSEPQPYYTVEQVLKIFQRNNIIGILATSRPNVGTNILVEAKPKDLWIVPFIRPYRVRADIPTWHKDPTIMDLVEEEYKRGYYRGIGEFHIYGEAARNETAAKIVRFAVEHNLFLHAHCDDTALEILFSHDSRAKIIWAHTGFSTSPARIDELLKRYPALWGELSYRSGITAIGGKLSDDWVQLFARHSERFLLGSDTWINERWVGYDSIMSAYRGWLVQLPKEQAEQIAYKNAERLFKR
jgi:hypothetical protein